jgi:hypothetical protein
MVSSSEGNEARREGCQGVAVPHSRVEAGERALPDPVERRGCRVADRRPESRRGHRTSQRVTARPPGRVRDMNPRRDEPDAPSTRTSGSVGALGSNPQGDPAQLSADTNCLRVAPMGRAATVGVGDDWRRSGGQAVPVRFSAGRQAGRNRWPGSDQVQSKDNRCRLIFPGKKEPTPISARGEKRADTAFYSITLRHVTADDR